MCCDRLQIGFLSGVENHIFQKMFKDKMVDNKMIVYKQAITVVASFDSLLCSSLKPLLILQIAMIFLIQKFRKITRE